MKSNTFLQLMFFFNSWHLSARKFIDNARRNSFLVNLGSVNMVN